MKAILIKRQEVYKKRRRSHVVFKKSPLGRGYIYVKKGQDVKGNLFVYEKIRLEVRIGD